MWDKKRFVSVLVTLPLITGACGTGGAGAHEPAPQPQQETGDRKSVV